MIEYARLTLLVGGPARQRTAWVQLVTNGRPGNALRQFRVVKRDGEVLDERIIAAQKDIVREKPARMNPTYGELETVPDVTEET